MVTAEPEEEHLGALSDQFEEAAPSNQYLTKKDFRRILLGLAIFVLICAPLYMKLNADRMRYICGQNFHAMSLALTTYTTDNNDCLPPTYVPEDNTRLPRLDDADRPTTWASILSTLGGFDVRKYSFSCPAADHSETMIAGGPGGADLKMAYGMYTGLNVAPMSHLTDSSRTVLITETANDGALKTYDPHPMSRDGKPIRDGFLIGWATGDFDPPADNKAPPPSVTRVAIRDSPNGLTGSLFKDGAVPQGRHEDSLYVIFADGHYQLVKAGRLMNMSYWDIPPK